jgi:hypothetical protein
MSHTPPEPFEYPWDQMRLFPPTHLHLRLDVWLKSDDEMIGWAWTTREGLEEMLMGSEASATHGGEPALAEIFANALRLCCRHLMLMEALRDE